jgi:hypothetical protein
MSHLRIIHLASVACAAVLLVSCASTPECPPCEPEIKTVNVYYPHPVLIRIQLLAALDLPPVPPMAPDDASDEEKKEAAIAIAEAREKREAILRKRDEAWAMKVREHNSQEVDVPDPVDP